MLFNYLKVTFRNLWKEKLNAFINLLGLSIGIACAILIILYVTDELTFDKFHSKIDDLYRVKTLLSRGGEERVEGMAPFVFATTAAEAIPEIEGITVHTSYSDVIEHEGQTFRETMTLVGGDFFNMFDFDVIHGSTHQLLDDPSSIVIDESTAVKYFGQSDVVDQVLRITIGGELKDYTIKAVITDVPSNSSLQFNILMGDANLKSLFEERQLSHWFMIAGEVYVLLREGTDPKVVEAKFPAMLESAMGEEMFTRANAKNELQPMRDIHLGENISGIAPVSDRKYTIILTGIAFLILLIASINFVTITLAKSITRMKEIGVRKSIGAYKSQLVFQFLTEAIFLALLALGAGLLMVWAVLPLFNELAQKSLIFQLTPLNSLIFLGLTLVIGIIAGFYPAIVLSRFNPTTILKGEVNVGSGRQWLRTVMVGGQFVLTIFLISSTLIMRDQLNYLQEKNLGFDKELLVEVPLNVESRGGMRQSIIDGFEKSKIYENALRSNAEINGTFVSSHTFGPGSWTNIGYPNEDGSMNEFFFNTVSPEFVAVLGLTIVQGRSFEVNNEVDNTRSIIVNEAFVKAYNLEFPIGARIPSDDFDEHEIIGVVQDFNFASLHMPVEPLVLAINTNIGFSGAHGIDLNSSPVPKVVARVQSGSIQESLDYMEEKWGETYPGEPFSYQFVDELLTEQYQQEQNLGKLVTSASILAVLIGGLGLFALSMLTMTARSKEMSIRKVLGASNKTIVYVLSKGYVLLILVAMAISIPLSYQAMNNWLNDFEFRITIGPSIYIAAGFVALLIAFLSIGYHSLKLAISSPVDGLRSE
jgi:putative ABC transport system permease protein